MSSKIYLAEDDPSPDAGAEQNSSSASSVPTSVRLPPLSAPVTTPALSLPPLVRTNSAHSNSPKRIPSFRKSCTFKTSRHVNAKIKTPRMIFRNHTAVVLCVASMNNYKRVMDEFQDTLLISGGDDKEIYVSSLLLGTTRMKMSGHEQRVSGLTTYTGTKYPSCVISCSWDETIKIWKVDDCFKDPGEKDEVVKVTEAWKTLRGHTNRICCVIAFEVKSPAGAELTRPLLASGSTDGSIKIWNFELQQAGAEADINTDCLFTIIDEINITWYLCLTFLHTPEDGHVLISGSKDNFVRLWSLDEVVAGTSEEGTNSKPFRVLLGHTSKITNLCLTTETVSGCFDTECALEKREYRIITTCHDLVVRVFSLQGELLRTLNEVPTPTVSLSICDSLRDKCDIIITAGVNGGIRVWRSLTGELLHVFSGFIGSCTAVHAIPSPDKKGDVVMWSGGADHSTRVFVYSVEKTLRVLKHKHVDNPNNIVKINAVRTFLAEGIVSPLVFGGCNDGTIWCWLLNRGEDEAVVKYTNTTHSSRVRALVVYSPPQGVDLENIPDDEDESTESDKEMDKKALQSLPVAFTPEDDEAGEATIFDLDLSKPLILSAGRDRDIVITLIDSGVPVAKIDDAAMNSITSLDIFTEPNPDVSPFIVCGSESNNARIFSFKHGNRIQTLRGHEFDVTCVKVFTPRYKPPPKAHKDGVSASASRSVSRQTSARAVGSLSLNNVGVSHVRNPIILTGSMDNTVIVWVYDKATDSYIEDAILTDSPTYISCIDICQLSDKAVIAAGNGDGDVYLWSVANQMELDQRDIEYNLAFVYTGKHTDELFSVTMISPEGLPPVLVSASGDNTLVLWSLETFKFLQLIEGHTGDITSAQLFAPAGSEPLLASASIDGTIRVISDFFGNLPKADAVDQAYLLDEQDRQPSWPRLRFLVKKFQPEPFFQLYYCLFFRALESGLPEFLAAFLPMSTRALIRSNCPQLIDMKGFSADYKLQSLLGKALAKDNAPAVHTIVTCWVTFFTRPVQDWKGDLIYDEKSNICRDDLLELANKYPSDFVRLVCSISLVPLEKNVLPDGVHFLDIGNDDEMDLVVSSGNAGLNGADKNFQCHIPDNEGNASHDEYTFLALPVRDLCHISLMKAYVAACIKTDDAGIFDSEVGILTLSYCWRLYGRKYHIYSMKVYVCYALVSSVTLFSFKSSKDSYLVLVPVTTMILQLLLTFYMFSTEMRQLYKEQFAYFHDVWNFNDAVVTICSTIGNCIRLVRWEETDVSRVLLSISIICVHFKILFFLRAFETSGPLVSMIVQIWNDMQSLLGILALVIMGFSQAFWLVSEVDSNLPFSSVQDSFLNSYSFMLGGYDPTSFEGAPLESWALFLSVVFMLVMNLLLLNLLIALMGNSYTIVQEKGNAQWRLEQTQVVLDHASQLKDEVKTHSMVHVRRRTEVLKRLQDERESAREEAEGIRSMVQELGERVDRLSEGVAKLVANASTSSSAHRS